MTVAKKQVVPSIIQKEGEEVAPQILATAIVKLDEAVKKMFAAGLKRDAIVLLLHDCSGVGKPAVREVLNGMQALRARYTTR